MTSEQIAALRDATARDAEAEIERQRTTRVLCDGCPGESTEFDAIEDGWRQDHDGGWWCDGCRDEAEGECLHCERPIFPDDDGLCCPQRGHDLRREAAEERAAQHEDLGAERREEGFHVR